MIRRGTMRTGRRRKDRGEKNKKQAKSGHENMVSFNYIMSGAGEENEENTTMGRTRRQQSGWWPAVSEAWLCGFAGRGGRSGWLEGDGVCGRCAGGSADE